MTPATYIVGLALLAISIGPLAGGAIHVRRRLVSGWTGLPAVLADAVLTMVLLLAVLHLLGSVGLFQTAPVVVACAALGAALMAVLARRPSGAATPEPQPPRSPRALVAAAAVACAVVVAQWTAGVRAAFDRGIYDYDSWWYHLPHAARWVQEGWITHLHFTTPEAPSAFHPGDNELLHAFGMLLFKGDLLSPLINLGWLVLALVASWTLGRRWGAGPVVTIFVATLAVSPLLVETQSGTAENDIATIAMLLVVAAFLVQPCADNGKLVVGGAAAGLGLGIKLTLVAPMGLLAVGVLVIAPKGRRRVAAAAWWIPMIAAGAFWYLRNLARVGSPVPALHIPGLPSPYFGFIDDSGQTIAGYFNAPSIWSEWFAPALRSALGPLWPVVLAVVVVGLVASWPRGTHEQRVLSVAAVAGLLSYVATPTSACCVDGSPALFGLNFRYAFPEIALAVALLPIAPVMRRTGRQTLLVVGAGVVLIASELTTRAPFVGAPVRSRPYLRFEIVAAVALLLGAAVIARFLFGRGPRLAARLAVVGITGMAIFLGFAVQRHYVKQRYREESWIANIHGNIGLAGSDQQYPLYGSDLANRVQFVGRSRPNGEFHAITSCAEWRSTLARDRDNYVVLREAFSVRSTGSPDVRPELDWTRTDPAATLFLQRGPEMIYRLDGTSNPTTCPG